MTLNVHMHKLAELIKNSSYCVFMSGAGVSTLSGIPDFRGSNGLYTKFDTDRLFDLEYFYEDPSYFYTHGKELIYNLDAKQPNIIHNTLADMENKGFVKIVITQNIDMLHNKAGSVNIVNVHGSPAVHHCIVCDRAYSYDEICHSLKNDPIPHCKDCNGLIKPDITFFGEMLDHNALDRAIEASSRADLFVVIGSSLAVHPAAGLPLYSLRSGGKLVIINKMKTPLDDYACIRYYELEEVFGYLSDFFNNL